MLQSETPLDFCESAHLSILLFITILYRILFESDRDESIKIMVMGVVVEIPSTTSWYHTSRE